MGMLELGMTMSYEQLLIDQEIVTMVRRVLQGIVVNKETLALDVIKEVGASGHYLESMHTVKHMRNEISMTKLIDRKMRQSWVQEGSKHIRERAREEALKIYKSHKPMPLEPEAASSIRAIIEEAEEAYFGEIKYKK